MERTPFTVPATSGSLSGWLVGEGQRVLAIHGGPVMSYDYLDDAVNELAFPWHESPGSVLAAMDRLVSHG